VPERHARLIEMLAFLERRLDEELVIADDIGDDLLLAFARGTTHTLRQLRRDVDERPWAHGEIERYLVRAVRVQRDHLEFRAGWS